MRPHARTAARYTRAAEPEDDGPEDDFHTVEHGVGFERVEAREASWGAGEVLVEEEEEGFYALDGVQILRYKLVVKRCVYRGVSWLDIDC